MVQRTYRQKQENPWLSICITQLRGLLQKVFQTYYLVVYKVIPHEENKQFSLSRHGNAKHPHAPPYFRQDPATNMRKVSSFHYIDMETQNIHTPRRIFNKILQL